MGSNPNQLVGPCCLALELVVPLRYALALLSSLKKSDALTFTAETDDNRIILLRW